MNDITFDDSLSILEQATENLKQACAENNINYDDEEYLAECSNQLEQNLQVFTEIEKNNSDKTTWESLRDFIKNIIGGIIYNFKQAIEDLKNTIIKHKKSINSSSFTKDFPKPVEVKTIAIENGRAKLKTTKVKNCLELEKITAASDKTIADKMAAKQKEELSIYTKYSKYINDKASNHDVNEFAVSDIENAVDTLLENIAVVPVVEAKEFPVQFTDDGDLLIKNYKKMNYNQEYQKSHEMIKTYDKSGSIEGIKYELARLWFINTILTALAFDNPKITDDERKEYMKIRSWVMNDFVTYNKKLAKLEPKFNFSEYYNTTPFSDVYIKINSSTMKFMGNLLKNILTTIVK